MMEQEPNKLISKSLLPKTKYFMMRSPRKGPVVMITAGIHGSEIAGVIAAQSLLQQTITCGTLIVVPIVNFRAYLKGVRGKPDINRTFPRGHHRRALHSIAREVFRLARIHKPDWCIDLHEANGLYRLNHSKLGQTVIVYPNPETTRIISSVVTKINPRIAQENHRFTVISGKLPGSFRTSTGQLIGCHSITVETSIQQAQELRTHYQNLVVRNLLHEIGLL